MVVLGFHMGYTYTVFDRRQLREVIFFSVDRNFHSLKMSLVQPRFKSKDGTLAHFLHSSSPAYNVGDLKQTISPAGVSSGAKTSPIFPFVIVLLAVVFFICGLLHLLVRFLKKNRFYSSSVSESTRNPEFSGSDAFQRQLQQLFHLHDSGLDQAFIDALPVFLYKEIMGLKQPFDCAVCLCEFSVYDKLRLLPMCSHAFHLDCIDTWLLSNSTCPLCRGALFTPGFPIENPVFYFDYPREEDVFPGNRVNDVSGQKPGENEIVNGKRVFSVRLGKFRNTNKESRDVVERVEGETSSTCISSNLDTRRCYSMGSYQYVVAESDLLVALCPRRGGSSVNMKIMRGRGGENDGGGAEGKKIDMRSKGESFSVSKIWQWSNKKGNLPNPSETYLGSSSVNVGLP